MFRPFEQPYELVHYFFDGTIGRDSYIGDGLVKRPAAPVKLHGLVGRKHRPIAGADAAQSFVHVHIEMNNGCFTEERSTSYVFYGTTTQSHDRIGYVEKICDDLLLDGSETLLSFC